MKVGKTMERIKINNIFETTYANNTCGYHMM